MLCRNCGKKIKTDIMFCPTCGMVQTPIISQTINQSNRKQTKNFLFIKSIKNFFVNYVNFKGRATTSEYWCAILFLFLMAILLTFIPIIQIVFIFGTTTPFIALSIRRLHDIGKCGWYFLLILVPLIGFLILSILYCKKSVADNQWGPSPTSTKNTAF